MKKAFSLLLCLFLLLSLLSPSVLGAQEEADISKFEFPTPAAPNYLMFETADREATEGNDALYVVRQTDMTVLELSAEAYADRDAFLEKYGLYDFTIIMQYDTSLDGTDNWNYSPEWDTDYSAPSAYEACPIAWIGGEMMERETLFDLYYKNPENENYSKMANAIIQRDVPDGDYTFSNFYFDYENHSLYIRCRYYMEWETYDGETIGQRQSKYSDWSDVAIFGKDSTAIMPEEPTGYEAPIISDLQFIPPDEGGELGSLSYIQVTPQQVWNAGIYYVMTEENGNFDGLETEISIDGGEWQPYQTVDAWGDWCLWNGLRTAYYEEPRIEADSHIKFRIRFAGTHGPSDWSNELELNGGGTLGVLEETHAPLESQSAPSDEPLEEHCTLCGFCPQPLGLCIFIWLAIVVALVIFIILITAACKSKKRRNAK